MTLTSIYTNSKILETDWYFISQMKPALFGTQMTFPPLWASWQWTESWRPPWCQQRPGTISWCQERGECYLWPSSGHCSFACSNWDNGIQDYHSLDTYFSIDPVLEQFNFHKYDLLSNFNIPQIYSERLSVLILRSITCLIQLCSKSEQIYLSKNKSAYFPVLLWHFWY